jgi:hypothetical protein
MRASWFLTILAEIVSSLSKHSGGYSVIKFQTFQAGRTCLVYWISNVTKGYSLGLAFLLLNQGLYYLLNDVCRTLSLMHWYLLQR